MDIWDIIESRYSDSSDNDYFSEEEYDEKPITYVELIKVWSTCKLLEKFTLPTPEQALKDLNRILSSQKFRVWKLVKSSRF